MIPICFKRDNSIPTFCIIINCQKYNFKTIGRDKSCLTNFGLGIKNNHDFVPNRIYFFHILDF